MPSWEFVEDNADKQVVPETSKPFFNPKGITKGISNLKRDIRDYTRLGSRALEAALGTPGNIADLALGAANYVSGGKVPTYGDIQSKLPVSLPTSSQLKDFSSKVTGGYTNPQSEGEEFWDNVVSDFTALALPGGFKNLGKLALSAGTSLAANLASKGAKNLGFGKTGQAVAHVGTTLLSGMIGTRNSLANTMRNSFDEAEKAAAGQFANGAKLSQQIKDVMSKIDKRDFLGKDFITERLGSLKKLIDKKSPTRITNFVKEKFPKNLPNSPHSIPIDQVVQRVKDLNTFYGDKNLTKNVRGELHNVAQPLRDFLDEYSRSGTQAAKKFADSYYTARDIWQGFNNSSKIGDFLGKNVNIGTLKNPLAKAILYASPWFNKLPHVLGGVATAVGVREAAKFADLLANSKTAAKAYRDIGLSALSGSAYKANQSLKAFDRAVTDYGYLPEGAEWVD